MDFLVRLAKPVNTKAGPATTAQLKTELRLELTRLFLVHGVSGSGS
jgi:ribonuclease P protein component